MPKRSFSLLKEELRKQVPRITLLVVLALVGAGVGLIQPLLFKVLLDTAIPTADAQLIGLLLVGMVIVPVLSAGLHSANHYLRAYIAAKALPNACAERCLTICSMFVLPSWSNSRPENSSSDSPAVAAGSVRSTSANICCR